MKEGKNDILQKYVKKYQSSDTSVFFPDHDIDAEKKKEPAYFKRCIEYLFYLGCNSMLHTQGLLTNRSGYGQLREYEKGRINPDKYKPFLLGLDEDGKPQSKGFLNISWRPDTGYLKTLDQMSGAYEKMDYDLSATAIDPASDYERKLRVAKMKVDADPEFKALLNESGVSLPKGEDPQFDNEQDIDLYEKSGGLKLKTEIAMQKAINASRQSSSWRVLKSMCFNDIRSLGFAALKDYVDYQSSMAMLRYVDPDYLLIPRSKYNDFRDISMAGELRMITIAEMRNESQLSEDALCKIAQEYGWSGQLSQDVLHNVRQNVEEGMPYDHVGVWCLDASWLSSDVHVYSEKRIEKFGNLDYRKKSHDYELTKKEAKDGRKAWRHRIQYCYKGTWVIGTDVVFNYGKDYYQKREGKDGNKKALLPYHVVTTGTMSKLERMIGDIDDINILTYKRRNAIASIPAPPGIIINKSALENVEFDGSVKSPQFLVKMLLEKGVLAVDTVDPFGRREQSINDVVSYVSTNLFEQFRIFSEQIEEKRRNIQLATGINDLVDGSSDNERRLKAEGEAKLEAANNAMQPEYAAMRELIQKAYTNVMYRWQEIVKNEEIELESIPLDGDTVEVIKLTADLARPKFGLVVKVASTYQERQMLMQEIFQLKQQRSQSGAGGIPEDAYLMLYRVIKEGNIPLAQLLLAKARKEAERADMERSMALQQQNAEVQGQAAQLAEVEKRKTIFSKAAADIIVMHSKYKNEAMLEAVKADLKDGELDNQLIRSTVEQIMAGSIPNLGLLEQVIMSGKAAGEQQQGAPEQALGADAGVGAEPAGLPE
jgi:hypothetical protein